ncbi:hypothetical protein KKF91_05035 [Myxococcota bacterium]|nr:hypothetical protein [Myxococcota bacterium]MBU1429912.1 hypothetical protein [Myxococcota bacterium]MBU1898897.1 hypothetical protein [Myxococcota bacterium]
MMRALAALFCLLSVAYANPKANLLLDTIDVYLTEANMASVGLDAAYAERILLDEAQRRYRRVRALGALAILAPDRAFEVLAARLRVDPDPEVRIQAAIHLNRVFATQREPEIRQLFEAVKAQGATPKLRAIMDGELRRLEAHLEARRVAPTSTPGAPRLH